MISFTRSLRNVAYVAASAAAITGFASTASAQAGLQSNVITAALTATRVPSLSLTLNSGANPTIASLTDGTTNDFGAVNVTAAWDLNPGTTASVRLIGWFADPTQALVNGTDKIASSLVSGKVGTGGTFSAFTSNAVGGVGVAGASNQFYSVAITGANKKTSRTDDLFIRIDLTSAITVPGDYTGTLNLRAVTQ